MLKRYIGRIEPSEKKFFMYYWFTLNPECAWYWDTKEQADIAAMKWNCNGIEIPLADGRNYVCRHFESEEVRSNEFAVYCEGPSPM